MEADLKRHEKDIREGREAARVMGEKLHERINGLDGTVGDLNASFNREFGEIGAQVEVVLTEVRNGHKEPPSKGGGPMKAALIRVGGMVLVAVISGVVTTVVALLAYFG